jgi:hypothetical protein
MQRLDVIAFQNNKTSFIEKHPLSKKACAQVSCIGLNNSSGATSQLDTAQFGLTTTQKHVCSSRREPHQRLANI